MMIAFHNAFVLTDAKIAKNSFVEGEILIFRGVKTVFSMQKNTF